MVFGEKNRRHSGLPEHVAAKRQLFSVRGNVILPSYFRVRGLIIGIFHDYNSDLSSGFILNKVVIKPS